MSGPSDAGLVRRTSLSEFIVGLDPYADEMTSALGIITGQEGLRLTLSAPRIGFGRVVFVRPLVEMASGYVTFYARASRQAPAASPVPRWHDIRSRVLWPHDPWIAVQIPTVPSVANA
ncbi:MAG: hypothetical protein EOP32_02845 [Rhodococcus sp. (in: high G+C Gram-positive bacteria)]|nr:MAG: hypothetical protein EOP32_02845 [Rhodococcus sp. (in: high G+C Gram-positive bacteria)]